MNHEIFIRLSEDGLGFIYSVRRGADVFESAVVDSIGSFTPRGASRRVLRWLNGNGLVASRREGVQEENMVHTSNTKTITRTRPPAPFVELRQTLSSRVAAISPFVDRLVRFIDQLSPSPDACESVGDIEVALREALANAIVHGNHEIPTKYVYVVCRCSMDGEVSISVRDEGEGFDSAALQDPTISANCLRTNGRGVYLMKALMDEVSFEENGNVVSMRKQLLSSVTERQSAVS